MSMGSEKGFLEEIQLSENQRNKLLRQGFVKKTIGQHPDGPRSERRSKLLPSGLSKRGKTSKLRNKFRNNGNERKVLVQK